MKEYLKKHALLHPSMMPRDVFKMIYQASFGAEHLLEDLEAAKRYFQREYEGLAESEETLYEEISDKLCRVNLRSWKKAGLPAEWLFEMFAGTVAPKLLPEKAVEGREAFDRFLREAEELVAEDIFAFDRTEWEAYKKEYFKGGLRAVHHSESYRQAECPAYRLVNKVYLRLLPVLEALEQQLKRKETPVIIAIDGQCASGKTTMASLLSEITDAGVIHMDDFFLPVELRTPERLEEPGGNVHYERFWEEVLPNLSEESGFSYRKFDCSVMALAGEREVVAGDIYIVEGAYSCHPYFGGYADIKVFSGVDSGVQLERIAGRDGEEMLQMFKERWIPMEEKYFTAFRIEDKADIIMK